MILAFNIQNVLIGGAFVGVLGLVLGVALGIIGKVFFVKKIPKRGFFNCFVLGWGDCVRQT